MTMNLKRLGVASLAGGVLLALLCPVMASNIAGRIVRHLDQANKIFTFSLPQISKYATADDVFQDIDAKCGSGTTAKIERINPSVGGSSRTTWIGSGGSALNFPIVSGQGYLVEVTAPCNWSIVGYNTDTAYTRAYTDFNKVLLISVPFNSTATVANDLFTQISNCTSVERINVSTGGSSRTTWIGAGGASDNFPIVRGEAYIITVSGTSSWPVGHY